MCKLIQFLSYGFPSCRLFVKSTGRGCRHDIAAVAVAIISVLIQILIHSFAFCGTDTEAEAVAAAEYLLLNLYRNKEVSCAEINHASSGCRL